LPLYIQEDKLKTLKNWFIVDIGYSSSSKSCGYYTSEKDKNDISYGELAETIKNYANNKKEIGLIIEAPLSISFDKNGNPKGRRPEKIKFSEKEIIDKNLKIKTQTRYWYFGAAATVSLATLELLNNIKSSKTSIYLFEGMVTFKIDEDSKESNHWKDAELLYRCLNKDMKENQKLFEDNTSNYFLGKYMYIPTIKETNIPPLIKVNKNCVEIFSTHEK
jgi:hypothetical protein